MAIDDLTRRQEIEVDFWRDSPTERPESNSLENIVNKVSEAGIFLDILEGYRGSFERARDVLELGGGQGWASCIVKREFPHTRVTLSDISEHAVASVPKWERIYETAIDDGVACKSYEIPVEDSSLDLVFAFAAAHHFVAHRRTFAELHRVLRPGGEVLYLYEPSCPAYIHGPAYKRVNRKRPEVPEDVLITDRIMALAGEAGLAAESAYYTGTRYRSAGATAYYMVVGRIPILQRVLPCTTNYRFVKSS